jgi:hypothetical protein
MEKLIKEINNQLWEKNGFLYKIYEKKYFDKEDFNCLINSIRKLNKKFNVVNIAYKKYNDCVWFSFIANIINKITLLIYIELNFDDSVFNINISEYHDYVQELNYEIQSLFAKFNTDYHGNKY